MLGHDPRFAVVEFLRSLRRVGSPLGAACWMALWVMSALLGLQRVADGCPFCADLGNTLSQDVARSDAAVVATVVDVGGKADGEAGGEAGKDDEFSIDFRAARFRLARFVKDSPQLQRGDEFTVRTNMKLDPRRRYLLVGFGKRQIAWSAPQLLSESAERYVIDSRWAPSEPAGRLAFFLPFLDDAEPLIAEDAYKEFAKAPYADVKTIREKLDRERLLQRLEDAALPYRLRRLYLTLLGIAGRAEDVARLLPYLERPEDSFAKSLDATLACLMTLGGESMVERVESRYFINRKTHPRETQAALAALRFQMDEARSLPRERLLTAARHLLDRHDLADLIIGDLIRWEDWTVSEQMTRLFKTPDKDTAAQVRHHVIHYLKSCPQADSAQRIEELRRVDPKAVELAEISFVAPSADDAAKKIRPSSPPSAAVDTETTPVGGTAANETVAPPRVARPALATASWGAKRLFVYAALCLAAGVALTVVLLLLRKPVGKD